MSTPATVYCEDCKHFDPVTSSRWNCDRKRRLMHRDSLVKRVPDTYMVGTYESGRDERSSILPWRCGKRARYFLLKVAP